MRNEDLLKALPWSRKPAGPREVKSSISVGNPALEGLAHFAEYEILPGGWASNFQIAMPPYFTMRGRDGKYYAVNTQGYDYLRYVVRIDAPVVPL